MSGMSSRSRVIRCSLLALLLATPLCFAKSGLSPGPRTKTYIADLSNDDLWGDGFGFGAIDEAYARVFAIAVVENNVFVGGRFTTAAGNHASAIARWDGSGWSNLGGGLDNCRGVFCFPTVHTLVVRGKDLYAGGNFLAVGGVSANRVARWDGGGWSALGEGVQICDRFNDCVTVLSMAATPSELYSVGRLITDVASYDNISTLESFTKWDGNGWTIQGGVSGLNASVSLYAVEAAQKKVYVGGVFSRAGLIGANNIAGFDGTQWNAMAGGVEGCTDAYQGFPCSPYVYTIAAAGDDVYFGGGFTSAGGGPAHNIAEWYGWKWAAIGEGGNGPVRKIAISGNSIYVGGEFTSIGGVPASGVARFDGNQWSALGSGVDGYVDALAFKDNEVYVGGVFSKAGGKPSRNFARWIDPTFVPPPPPPLLPQITGISIVRKTLTLTGARFDLGAVILLNGEKQKTQNDEQNPTTQLIARKSGKKIRNGDKLQVQNPDGKLSPEFMVTL